MSSQSLPLFTLPLTTEQLARLTAAVEGYTPQQLAWLSGYLWGKTQHELCGKTQDGLPSTGTLPATTITLISASQTGNARRLAEQTRDELQASGLAVQLINAADYKFKQIAQETVLLLVVSTQGEGDPPEEAIGLHKFLSSKKAPALAQTEFAVFGLGDSSYEFFCHAGKQFEQRLTALGAKPLLARVDADVEYQQQAQSWIQQLVDLLKDRQRVAVGPTSVNTINAAATAHVYSKEKPFEAELLVNQKITGRDSQKEIRHLEIDLADSGLRYQPGDALGVWYQNNSAVVAELLGYLRLSAESEVSLKGQTVKLHTALQENLELTQNSAPVIKKYAAVANNASLSALAEDKNRCQHYAENTPIVDMVRQFPAQISAQQFVDLLRPLTPRLYSIASSQAEVENEVHITVSAVRYAVEGHPRSGGASGYLADSLQPEGKLNIFIEHNPHFRLPDDPNTAIIMIGPGTGIAPFRAFMQQRAASGAQGKNWLFFGNPHFTQDFLYQVEWQGYVKEGLLTRIDLAWSRDHAEKVYVQDTLRQQASEVWNWLQQGAHIYVCGDANRMAKDVEQALLEVIAQQGGMDSEHADEFLSELRAAKRYQRDVY